ncbi:hypothetical protein [Streptomyces mirabilis]|uniref:hypothetical protein n=1 Tax=Streptomyces mirabilis TaxID=68239 RepID=UPI0033A4889A
MSIRRKIATSVGTVALAAISCLVTSPAAHAVDDGAVQIQFRNGLCLDVPNSDAHPSLTSLGETPRRDQLAWVDERAGEPPA